MFAQNTESNEKHQILALSTEEDTHVEYHEEGYLTITLPNLVEITSQVAQFDHYRIEYRYLPNGDPVARRNYIYWLHHPDDPEADAWCRRILLIPSITASRSPLLLIRVRYRNDTGSTSTSTLAPRATATFPNHSRNIGCTATSRRVFSNSRRRCRPRNIDSGAGAGPSPPPPPSAPRAPNPAPTRPPPRRYPRKRSAPPAAHKEANAPAAAAPPRVP